jgi:hypothetical protein
MPNHLLPILQVEVVANLVCLCDSILYKVRLIIAMTIWQKLFQYYMVSILVSNDHCLGSYRCFNSKHNAGHAWSVSTSPCQTIRKKWTHFNTLNLQLVVDTYHVVLFSLLSDIRQFAREIEKWMKDSLEGFPEFLICSKLQGKWTVVFTFAVIIYYYMWCRFIF